MNSAGQWAEMVWFWTCLGSRTPPFVDPADEDMRGGDGRMEDPSLLWTLRSRAWTPVKERDGLLSWGLLDTAPTPSLSRADL